VNYTYNNDWGVAIFSGSHYYTLYRESNLHPLDTLPLGNQATSWLTVDAVVGCVEVGGEVLGTGLDASTQTRYRYLTPGATGTGGIQHADDVCRAADEAVVTGHTAA